MMNEQMSMDMLSVSETPIQWKVSGCGYSWIVTMTILDIHYLYDSLFSNQYRLNNVEPSIPADADDLAVRIILHGVDGRENLLQLLRVASVVGMYLGTVHGEVDVG